MDGRVVSANSVAIDSSRHFIVRQAMLHLYETPITAPPHPPRIPIRSVTNNRAAGERNVRSPLNTRVM